MKDTPNNDLTTTDFSKKSEDQTYDTNKLNSINSVPYNVNNTTNASASNVASPVPQNNKLASKAAPTYGFTEGEQEGSESAENGEKKISQGGNTPNDETNPNENPNDEGVEVKEDENKDQVKDGKKKEGENKLKDEQKKSEGQTGEKEKQATDEGEKNAEDKEKEKGQQNEKGQAEVAQKATTQNQQKKAQSKKGKQKAKSQATQAVQKNSEEANKTINNANTAPAPQNAGAPSSTTGGDTTGETYAVSKENAGQLGGTIIKESPSGNVVVAPNGPVAEPAKLGATPLPPGIEQEENQKRQAENSKSIESFAAGNKSTIERIRQQGSTLVNRISVAISQAKSKIEIAEQQAMNKVASDVSAAVSSTTSAFDAAIVGVEGQYAAAISSINASTNKAMGDLSTSMQTLDADATAAEASLKTTAIGHMDAAINHMNTAATTKGAEAISLSEAQAAVEAAVPLEEQGFWSDMANGGDYPANKRKARVKACKEVGTRLQKEFLTQATDAAVSMENGKGESEALIVGKTAELKQSIITQIEQKRAELLSSQAQSIQSADALKNSKIDALKSAKETQVQTIQDLGETKMAEIQSTAAQQKSQVAQVGQSSKSSLQSTIQSGISALQSTNQSSISELRSQEKIKPENFKGIIASVQASFTAQADEFTADLSTSASGMESSLTDTASQGAQAIQQAATETSQALSDTVSQISQMVSSMQSAAESEFQQMIQGAESADSLLVTTITGSLEGQVQGFKTQMETALGGMGTDVMAKATEVSEGFQGEINAIGKTMSDAAKKAEDAVSPRWKSFLKILIDVVFAIALAVIVAALATVLGPFALILAAIAIGAALGVGKQMLNNAIDGKPIMEGTLKAAVLGGIEGLFAAVGAGALSKIMSKGGGMLTGRAASMFTKVAGPLKNFAGKAIGKFTTKLATNVAEKVTTQIATNVMDGKSWKTDLWKATSGAVIDTVMGEAGGKLTSKVGGSELLGDAVGDSFQKQAARKVTEVGIDFGMDTIGDGAKKVVGEIDEIIATGSLSEGLKMAGDKFAEGATTDMDDRLLKNGLNKAKDPIVNRVKDNIGNSSAQKDGLQAAPEGYAYNKVYAEDGSHKMDLRATHTQNSNGKNLADLTTDGNGGFKRRVTDFPEMDNIKSKEEFMQRFDPDGKLPKNISGEAYNYLRQGKKAEFEAAIAPFKSNENSNNNQRPAPQEDADTTSAPKNSKPSESAQRAEAAGLPAAPEGYHYSTSSKGTLYIRRNSKVDDNGNDVPRLKIDGDSLVEAPSKRPTPGAAPVVDDDDGSESGYRTGSSSEDVLAIPKGSRPASASEYLTPEYMADHARQFQDEGAGFIVVKSWTIREGSKYVSLPPRKFVGLRSEMDAVIQEFRDSGGDTRILDQRLSLGGDDISAEDIYYVRIDGDDARFAFDMPNGNEAGTIDGQWVPAGKTKDGTSEAALVGAENVVHNNNIDELMANFGSNWEKIN